MMRKESAKIIGMDVVDGDPIFKISAARKGESLVFRCPFCGEVHTHGIGNGHRVAHCINRTMLNRKGYELVEATDWRDAGIVSASFTDHFLRKERKIARNKS